MIDAHCHLEQKDYERDLGAVIAKCRRAGLKAIVTSCARPKDFARTMDISQKHTNFVFPTCSIHPEFIKDIKPEEVNSFLDTIKQNQDKIFGIGETGLDYNWVKENKWQEKQKDLFRQMIRFARELGKPLVIHARDAYEDVIEILEQEKAKHVQMHMFGANELTKRVIDNNWYISMNAIVLRGKKQRKVVRDTPLEKLMLETDAPWLAPDGWSSKRNDPSAIKPIAEKIAEIKKLTFEEVWEQCGKNAIDFFGLPIII